MPRCARDECRRWRPDTAARYAGLGLRVDDDWFCSSSCVALMAAERLRVTPPRHTGPLPVPPPRLGTLLVHQGAITPAHLDAALAAQKLSGAKLGAELVRLGYTDATAVLRALAAQAGVSYLTAVDVSTVRTAPGGLCVDEVRALGLVPIRAVDASGVLIVACTAPLPRAALNALGALTQWKPVPYLVTDEDLTTLMNAYGSGLTADLPRVRAASVATVAAAARRIADAATTERSIRVAEVHLDPFTWIRVAGRSGVDAMLLSRASEEGLWPAATIRH
jgi:hypothetical protein